MTYGDGKVRRDHGGWIADIGVGGKRVRVWRPTRAEAQAALVQLRAERVLHAARRPVGTRPDCTYTEAAERLLSWLGAGIDRVRTRRTIRSYRTEVARLLTWWGPRRLVDTTPALVAAYVAGLRDGGASTSTIRHLLDRLAQCHEQAVERERWMLTPPCAVPRPAYRARTERDAAPEAEVAALLEHAAERGRLCVLLARDAGLRRIEIARARGAHVALHPWDGACYGWISIPAGKGDRSRAVPIMTARLRDALVARGAGADDPLIDGVRSDNGVSKVINQAREDAGVASSLHQLRHAYATWLRDCGHPAAHRRAWVGHGDEATLDIYTHGAPDPGSDAAERSRSSVDRQKPPASVSRITPRGPS